MRRTLDLTLALIKDDDDTLIGSAAASRQSLQLIRMYELLRSPEQLWSHIFQSEDAPYYSCPNKPRLRNAHLLWLEHHADANAQTVEHHADANVLAAEETQAFPMSVWLRSLFCEAYELYCDVTEYLTTKSVKDMPQQGQ